MYPNVPQAEKDAVYQSYGLAGNHTGYCDTQQGCEVDHLISLELGGSNDQTNLWPQPYQGTPLNAHVKDQLENFLHAQTCAGNIALDQAQQEIATPTGLHPTKSGLAIADVCGSGQQVEPYHQQHIAGVELASLVTSQTPSCILRGKLAYTRLDVLPVRRYPGIPESRHHYAAELRSEKAQSFQCFRLAANILPFALEVRCGPEPDARAAKLSGAPLSDALVVGVILPTNCQRNVPKCAGAREAAIHRRANNPNINRPLICGSCLREPFDATRRATS